jgi:EAL domain-containing protein (putative c-di-GMP-specific phosphodiesterase class I)
MAHSLRLTVVAEGVETAGQLALLAEHGCDVMQGYYFSRPVPAEDFGRMLREGARLDPAPRAVVSQPASQPTSRCRQS